MDSALGLNLRARIRFGAVDIGAPLNGFRRARRENNINGGRETGRRNLRNPLLGPQGICAATSLTFGNPGMDGLTDIAMGFDACYAPHAANAMASIARHAPGARLRFILLYTGLDEALRRRIEAAVKGADFLWIEVTDEALPVYTTRGYISRAMLFRLGLEKLAPADVSRVVYIDADTVVLGDVRELWNADLGGHPIGAVTEYGQDPEKFAAAWGLPPGGRYFNSGVIVIDLKKVRAEKLFSRALDFVVEHDDEAKLPFPDQHALNYIFWKNSAVLEPTWNVHAYLTPGKVRGETAPDRRWGHATPRLIHYIGGKKPWMRDVWVPWAWAYWENMNRTPFAKDIKRSFGMGFPQIARLRLRWWLWRPGRTHFFGMRFLQMMRLRLRKGTRQTGYGATY